MTEKYEKIIYVVSGMRKYSRNILQWNKINAKSMKLNQWRLLYLYDVVYECSLKLSPGFIHQYMCLVPQDRKFCNAMTGEIILQSCRWVPDFSALSAARAFEAIEKYAANLINQPWRKEFREIKVQ